MSIHIELSKHLLAIKPSDCCRISRLRWRRFSWRPAWLEADMFIVCVYTMCVCVCVRNSHTDSRPVEHQPSSFIIWYTYILYRRTRTYHRCHLSGFPRGQIFVHRFPKGITTHNPRPNPPPNQSLYPAPFSSSSSSQVDDLKQTMGKPRVCSRCIIYIYMRDYNARRIWR